MAIARYSLHLAVLWVLSQAPGIAQEKAQLIDSKGWNLSLLRGTWSAHTFEMKWTLNFISDAQLLFNNRSMSYSLEGDRLSIRDRSANQVYDGTVVENVLRLRFPDGSWREFEKTSDGEEESLLEGRFYLTDEMLADSSGETPVASIFFRDHREFIDESPPYSEDDSLNPGTEKDISSCGAMILYRVEGSRILLTCENGGTGEALIRTRDADGYVTALIYLGGLYHVARPVAKLPGPGDVYYPPPPPPPPPRPPGPPHPHPPGPYIPVPPISCPPKPPVLPEKRDFGSTRGGTTVNESSSRESGQSRDGSRSDSAVPSVRRK